MVTTIRASGSMAGGMVRAAATAVQLTVRVLTGVGRYTWANENTFIGNSIDGRFVGPGVYGVAATNEQLRVRMTRDEVRRQPVCSSGYWVNVQVDLVLYEDGSKYVGTWNNNARNGWALRALAVC